MGCSGEIESYEELSGGSIMVHKGKRIFFVGLCLILSFTACAKNETGTSTEESSVKEGDPYIEQEDLGDISLDNEIEAIIEEVNPPQLLEVEATGTKEERSDAAVIDYSNTQDGYVMVQYLKEQANRLKVQVKGPTTTYTYNLNVMEWTTFPLSDGNGDYQVLVYENVVDNKYAIVLSTGFNVELEDEFAPFIRPNQYVDYLGADKTIDKAMELTKGMKDPLEKVEAVYDYVVGNITYDHDKASSVKSGYLPVLDNVLDEKKGICFDYAALMTGMLRSQGVPCKLVVGYAGSVYHAWINVWSEDTGWIDGVIYFDGKMWHRMDPTFASSGNQSESIMEYIGNGTNYTEKYLY